MDGDVAEGAVCPIDEVTWRESGYDGPSQTFIANFLYYMVRLCWGNVSRMQGQPNAQSGKALELLTSNPCANPSLPLYFIALYIKD